MIFGLKGGRWLRPGLLRLCRPAAMGPSLDPRRGSLVLPAGGRPPKQLVVFLHGVNGRGDGWAWLADVWRKYLPDAAFAFPDGIEPSRAGPDLFQWWELRSLDARHLQEGVRRASPRFQRFLQQVQDALAIAPEATIVGGFSQGAMLALHAGERSSPRLAGILACCGAVAGLPHHPAKVRSRPPVFLYHGTRDQIVPFAAFDTGRSRLLALGFEVAAYRAEGVDHTIDVPGAESAGRLMRHWLARGRPDVANDPALRHAPLSAARGQRP